MTNRAYPLEIRGIAHNSVDALHPLPERPEESLPLSYIETVRNGNFTSFMPDTSGRSSPTTDHTPSIVNSFCESNTWSTNTGNLTGRSSVYSWGNEDEFDRQASATVKRMFDEIDGMLFEGQHFNGSPQLLSECEEWFQRFPHLRICGYQLLSSKDDGTQLIPFPAGDTRIFSQRPQTSVLEDVEEFGAFDSQGLFIEGFHVDPLLEPPESYMNDEMNDYYTEFEEEVLEEDGEVVEYFGYDQPAVEEEGTEPSKDVKYRRQQRRGYPPVTPNACAKDAVVSQLFDQAWGEVVLWLRDLLSRYSQKLLRDKPQFLADVVVSSDRAIETPFRPFSQSVLSRNIFSSQVILSKLPIE
ncbi:protein FAM149B1-like isoform X2 [Orbicella faveolata]|uniref:protein FAM149B1-like isoform X2 n=1 Tax=Orbicella faveolata TaxID=48498 RepID=UPI0009E28E35|nr:protein FAM149B1-like isoform X2 [Orbicella faveolata]